MHKVVAIIGALINGDVSVESVDKRHISMRTVVGIEAAHN